MEKTKMTNAEVLGLLECLNAISTAELPLSPRNWFTLTANRKALIEHGKNIDDTRNELIKKYGEEQENGSHEIPKEDVGKFKKDYNEVLNVEINVELTNILLSDLEADTKKLNGVPNIYLFFEYIVSEAKRTPIKKAKKSK